MNILNEKLHISCLAGSFFLKTAWSFYNSTLQTATISKTMVKCWSKFHIQMLCHSFTRDNSFLLTSQSPPGKQEKPFNSVFRHNSSLSVYLFFNSELYPGKSKDFNEGIISQVKRAFKSYFLSPKNNKKADTFCMKFSLTSNSNVEMCLYPLFQN